MDDSTKPFSFTNREALEQVVLADQALFQAVAGWHAPILDRTLPALSNLANNSMIWVGTATVLAAFGGRRGRLVAADGRTASSQAGTPRVILVPIGAHRIWRSLQRRHRR